METTRDKVGYDMMEYSGWCFAPFFIFPHIGNVIIPTDFHIVQRGRYTTNQVYIYIYILYIYIYIVTIINHIITIY